MIATKSRLSAAALMSVPIGPRAPRSGRVFRSSTRDAWLVAIAVLHGVLVASIVAIAPRGLAAIAACGALALATVYTSNTVAHWHLHAPLFRSRAASRALSLGLTLVLGIPQTAWARRHRWHHAGEPVRRPAIRMTARLGIDAALLLAAVAALATLRPLALATLVPGISFGLCLSWIQGRLEHAGDPDVARSGVSHYGSLYNLLWFNDGFHAEHHRAPGIHWSHLPAARCAPPITSGRAPILRWLDAVERGQLQALALGALERVALLVPAVQEWLVHRHAEALVRVLAGHRRPKTVLAVGGGLFPRTALVLARVFPNADVTVLDASRRNLDIARRSLESRGARAPRMIHATFDPAVHDGFDLVVLPLAFVGERNAIARARSRNRLVVSHQWLFRAAPRSAIVSRLLMKSLVLA